VTHVRTQIREGAKTALGGIGATIIGRRAHGLDADALPVVEVTTPDETIERETQARPAIESRVVTIVCTIYAAASGDVEDDCDAIAEEVETAMHIDPTLGGAVRDMETTGGSFEVQAPGERTIGVREVRFQVVTTTRAGAAGTVL